MSKKGNWLIFVLYLLFAIYLVNSSLNLFSLPEFFSKLDKWILVFSGLFLILGGFNFLRIKRIKY